MAESGTDRNLFPGILALQFGFITSDALVMAVNAWLPQRDTPLGDILLQQGALDPETLTLLLALVEKHLQTQEGDAPVSMAALSTREPIGDFLSKIEDENIRASLSHLAAQSDPYPTRPPESSTQTPLSSARFRVIRPHARGGLGQVSVALDQELHREVALKEIQDQHADDQDSRSRFLLEAEVTGGLEHPGIVPVYSLGTYADGRPFYAMRFVRGDSLHDAIQRFHQNGAAGPERRLELRKLLGRFLDICNAIAYAHSRGVLHRDLKPGNVMLGPFGETLVVDWGLARVTGQATNETGGSALQPSISGSTPTELGSAVGTPAYMSPEQAGGRHHELGPASDVYGLGATLYHLLAGRPPCTGRDPNEVLDKVQSGVFPRPRQVQASVPPALEAICLRAMALRPADRYASARALADDVDRWMADERVEAYREPLHERLGRWTRRHRTATGSMAAAALALLLAAAVAIPVINDEKDRAIELADTNKRLAESERKEKEETEKARKQTVEALAQTRAAGYLRSVALADREWRLNRPEEVRRVLEDCPEDLRGWEWFAMRRQLDTALTVADAPSDMGVAWDDARGRVLAIGHQGVVRAIDPVSGRQLTTIELPLPSGTRVTDAGFDRTGRLVAVALWSPSGILKPGEVHIWDLVERKRIQIVRGHTRLIDHVRLSADGSHVVTSSFDNTVKLWDVKTGKDLGTFLGATDMLWGLAIGPDHRTVVAGGNDSVIRLWDAGTQKEVKQLRGHAGRVIAVAFTPDGRTLASRGDDRTVRLWDISGGRELFSLNTDAFGMAFSPDGHHLVTTGPTLRVWDLLTRRQNLELRGAMTHAVAYSPDGQRLVTGDLGGKMRVWNTTGQLFPQSLEGHTAIVHAMAFSPDGSQLVTGSADETVDVWDPRTGELLHRKTGILGGINSISFRPPDGKYFAIGTTGNFFGGKDGEVAVYETATMREIYHVPCRQTSINLVRYSPDGRFLLSASNFNKDVVLREAETGKEVRRFAPHGMTVSTALFSGDGKQLVTSGTELPLKERGKPNREQHAVRIWDVDSGKEVHALNGLTGAPGLLANLEGNLLAINLVGLNRPSQSILLDLPERQTRHTLQGLSVWAFTPDGKSFVGQKDGGLALFDSGSGELGRWLARGTAQGVAFSKDGSRMLAIEGAGVRVVSVKTGQELLLLEGAPTMGAPVISPDGWRLALRAAQGYSITLWDVQEPTPEVLKRQVELAGRINPGWHWRQTRLCQQAQHWQGLNFHMDRILQASPPSAETLTTRGLALAGLGEWDRAAADYSRALTLEVETPMEAHDAALVHLRRKDPRGYQQVCDWLKARCGRAGADHFTTWAPWTCALVPINGGELKWAVELAQKKADIPFAGFAEHRTLGALLFRAGRYDDALPRLTRAHEQEMPVLRDPIAAGGLGELLKAGELFTDFDPNWRRFLLSTRRPGSIEATWLFLAMTCHHRKEPAEARRWLAKAQERLDRQEKLAGASIPWQTRVELGLLRAETESLIGSAPPKSP
jgi:WD40 repeat protein/serine/threonine protein kinase